MMSENIEKIVEKITKVTYEEQNKVLRKFLRTDVETRCEIFSLQTSFFHQTKPMYKKLKNAVLTYGTLILAINDFYSEEDETDIEILKIRARKLVRAQKREYLVGKWAIVRRLRMKHNLSYRKIANYFQDVDGFEVSYSTVFKVWKELEE